MRIRKVISGLLGLAALACTGLANAVVIQSFTGADTSIEVLINDINGGGINVSFDITSTQGADLTSAFLGFNDSLFDASTINKRREVGNFAAFDADGNNVTGAVNWSTKLIRDVKNPLKGQAGLALSFDLDLGVRQDRQKGGNILVDTLTFSITEKTLTSNFVNAAGARLKSVGPNQKRSSKIVGGVVGEVPEPSTLLLMGIGLLGLGFARRRRLFS